MIAAILVIICGACVITCYNSDDENPVISPTDDSSQFVTITDVAPDLDKSVLFEQEYIYERSGHTRGSTVDLTLFDMTSPSPSSN